jgi:hypothetical protein
MKGVVVLATVTTARATIMPTETSKNLCSNGCANAVHNRRKVLLVPIRNSMANMIYCNEITQLIAY